MEPEEEVGRFELDSRRTQHVLFYFCIVLPPRPSQGRDGRAIVLKIVFHAQALALSACTTSPRRPGQGRRPSLCDIPRRTIAYTFPCVMHLPVSGPIRRHNASMTVATIAGLVCAFVLCALKRVAALCVTIQGHCAEAKCVPIRRQGLPIVDTGEGRCRAGRAGRPKALSVQIEPVRKSAMTS